MGSKTPTPMGTEASGIRVANRPPRPATANETVFRTRWRSAIPTWRAKHPPGIMAQVREEPVFAWRCRARRAARDLKGRMAPQTLRTMISGTATPVHPIIRWLTRSYPCARSLVHVPTISHSVFTANGGLRVWPGTQGHRMIGNRHHPD
jgi:hypothetical protein